MTDFLNIFEALQSFVLLLLKFSPLSSWTRPSWVTTGSGRMWEGFLPCFCFAGCDMTGFRTLHGYFGTVPFPKHPYIRPLGGGCGGCFFKVTDGIQHALANSPCHRSAIQAIRCLNSSTTQAPPHCSSKRLSKVLKYTYPSFNLEVSLRIWV